MKGDDFISLAIKLANSDNEARLRTSVSRAYFGAFHVARQLIEEMGVRLPRDHQAHISVQRCLQQSGDDAVEKAGAKLGSLRSERKDADYALENTKYRNKNSAAAQIIIARQILEALTACGHEPARSRFRSGVQKCARVHRWPVSD